MRAAAWFLVLTLPLLTGCLDRMLGVLISPQAAAANTVSAAATDATSAALGDQAAQVLDAASTANDLSRWAAEHPDAENADRLRALSDHLKAAQRPGTTSKPMRAGDDPERRIGWDRQVYGASLRPRTWLIGDTRYQMLPIEQLGKTGVRRGDRLRLEPFATEAERVGGRGRPLDAVDPHDDRPWLMLDVDPVRLGGRQIDVVGEE
jgi:hypothetical protein